MCSSRAARSASACFKHLARVLICSSRAARSDSDSLSSIWSAAICSLAVALGCDGQQQAIGGADKGRNVGLFVRAPDIAPFTMRVQRQRLLARVRGGIGTIGPDNPDFDSGTVQVLPPFHEKILVSQKIP